MVEGVEFLSAAEDTFDVVNIPKHFGTRFGRGWRPQLRVSGSLSRELVIDMTLEAISSTLFLKESFFAISGRILKNGLQ